MASRAPKPRLATIGAVALGGMVGAAARVYLPWPGVFDGGSTWIDPVPSLIVNLLAAALLGLASGFCAQRTLPDPLVAGLTTGLLGSFSTMSAIAVAYSLLLVGHTALAPTLLSPATLAGVAALCLVLLIVVALSTVLCRWMLDLGKRLGAPRP